MAEIKREPATAGELFFSAWEAYKKRALPILAVILVGTGIIGSLAVVMALFAGLGGALMIHSEIDRSWIILLTGISSMLMLITAITGLWLHTVLLIIIIDENPGVNEAFRRGWRYLRSMAWVTAIFSGLIVTGLLCGILPGILFMVWFSFSFYILLEEDRKGMDALLASMAYVRGNWWNTFGRLTAVWLPFMLIGIIPFAGMLFSIFLYPFLLLFMADVYHDLKASRGGAEIPAGPGTRILLWGIAAVGLILPVIALIGALLALLNGSSPWFEEAGYPY
ncbi:MAG: hypothetical protein SCH71_15000 [Desulfobulbaceae bacterium]|nr:hypothetical protein [Desulfobulbaceae bacterium]